MYIAKPMEMYDDDPNEQDNSQGFKYWNKMEANADVPTETILKYKVRECGQLKAEIDYLKNEIEWRDRAIADFKKWQSRMAEYKMEYWLCEAKKLLQESPNEREFKAAAKLLKKILYSKNDTSRYQVSCANLSLHGKNCSKSSAKMLTQMRLQKHRKTNNILKLK